MWFSFWIRLHLIWQLELSHINKLTAPYTPKNQTAVGKNPRRYRQEGTTLINTCHSWSILKYKACKAAISFHLQPANANTLAATTDLHGGRNTPVEFPQLQSGHGILWEAKKRCRQLTRINIREHTHVVLVLDEYCSTFPVRSKDLRDAAIFNLSSAGEEAGTSTEVRKPQPIRAAGTSVCQKLLLPAANHRGLGETSTRYSAVGRKLFQGHCCEWYVRNTNCNSSKQQQTKRDCCCKRNK